VIDLTREGVIAFRLFPHFQTVAHGTPILLNNSLNDLFRIEPPQVRFGRHLGLREFTHYDLLDHQAGMPNHRESEQQSKGAAGAETQEDQMTKGKLRFAAILPRFRWLLVPLAVIIAAVAIWTAEEPDVGQVGRFKMFCWILGVLVLIGAILSLAAHTGSKRKEVKEPEALSPVKDPQNKWFDLLKLEYDKGADRYENIYRAVWQNFSYAVAVGAALLTFAATKLRMDFLQFVALSPLVFWFVATFIPMNHYGERTRARLREIERDFNVIFFNGNEARKNNLGFRHFTDFARARSFWRVGDVVHFTGALVGLYWVWLLASVLTLRDPKKPVVLSAPPQTKCSTRVSLRSNQHASEVGAQRTLMVATQSLGTDDQSGSHGSRH